MVVAVATSVALLFVVISFLYYKFFYVPFQLFKKNGIKCPKPPSIIYGNFGMVSKLGVIEAYRLYHKQYGPVFGVYAGHLPVISVIDLDLIKLITVKDLDTFIDRFPEYELVNEDIRPPGLTTMKGKAWRSNRHILSPTFSSYKIRAMTPIIQNSVDSLVEVFAAQADTNRSFELYKPYGAFAMQTILATAFGRVIDIQRGVSDQLTEAATAVIKTEDEQMSTNIVFLWMVLSNFPWLEPLIPTLTLGSAQVKAFTVLRDVAVRILEERRKEEDATKKYKDLLQLMIDATAEEEDGENVIRKTTLSDKEIVGNAIDFMLAGYDTSANALSYTSYLLAINPHIQDKLQADIDAYYQEHPDCSIYQAAQDIEYLDMVLHESLRLYPPVPILPRYCNRDYKYKDFTIPKGCTICISSILLHKDPKYWKDPDEFDPTRFSAAEKAKRPQLCYMPFGSGPRSCIGMRFALLEAKMGLIELLKRFTFVRAPETKVPLETVYGITLSPKGGLHLRIVSRN